MQALVSLSLSLSLSLLLSKFENNLDPEDLRGLAKTKSGARISDPINILGPSKN